MKTVCLVVAAALLALSGASGYAAEMEVETLRARLAAQEARITDLQAKMNASGGGAAPEAIVSMRKNASVTVGGLVTTKYTGVSARMNSRFDENGAPGQYQKREDHKLGSLEVSDAELHVQIDVNDHFDAFILMSLHEAVGSSDSGGIAEVYYVRWKDICNSGFGLKVGRDALVFGADGVGELGSYAAGGGDGVGDLGIGFVNGSRLFEAGGSAVPIHNGWDVSYITQITPYWEGLDGKIRFELSFMNHVYDDTGFMHGGVAGTHYTYDSNGAVKNRSRNFGLGTMSARLGFSPIEGLDFTLSAANYHSNNDGTLEGVSKNNSAFGLAAGWRPAFFDRLYLWGQWVHGNDVYFNDDMTSDALNFGLSFDLVENMTWFAQGDYLRVKDAFGGANDKATAWAFYTGLQYSLPYGVNFEAGWKHERVDWKTNGRRDAKITGNTLYGLVGFEF